MSDKLVTRFRKSYWQAYRGLETVRLRQWERSHMTLPQLRVLFAVRRTPGVLTSALAAELGTTVSTTSGLVTKLVGRGLLDRRDGIDDRRQAPLFLTDTGAALAGEMLTVVDPFLLGVAELLGDDIGPVTEVLERVATLAQQVWDSLPDRAAAGAHISAPRQINAVSTAAVAQRTTENGR